MNLRDSRGPVHERILPGVSRLVPAPRRAEWAREWQAEFWQMRHADRATSPTLRESLSLAYGLIADALWLRMDWARISARGSAGGCLAVLSLYCVLCAAVELVFAGSWHGFVQVLAAHFSGGFVFVAVPGIFAAVATYPLRPLRCDDKDSKLAKILSTRARWNIFLAAKIALTLSLGFLFSLVASLPLRVAVGSKADWLELLLWALFVTAGLRWALLNQEQRCQKCLRMLSEPTRLGLPSRNFLEWSGTELACEDGHGLLHVAEMQGSWCWYDKWVELDPNWRGIFSA